MNADTSDGRARSAAQAPVFGGRRTELERIETACQAAGGGTGQFLLVSGEPGIGKTALAEHAVAGFVGWRPPVRCPCNLRGHTDYALWTRAVATVSGLTTYPASGGLAEALALAGHAVPDAPVHHGDADSRLPFLVDATVAVLREAADDQPVCVFIDDLHWADDNSIVLLEHLVGMLDGLRLLIIATSRPAERDLRRLRGVAARRRPDSLIDLTGLTAHDVKAIAIAMGVRSISNNDIADVIAKTAGNALLVENVLQQRAGRMAGSLTELADSMIEPLAEATRQVVRTAACIGSPFDLDILAQAADMPRDVVRDLLGDVLDPPTKLLRVAEAGHRFRFLHDGLVEKWRASLPPLERLRVHTRAYQAVADLHGAEPDWRRDLMFHLDKADLPRGVKRTVAHECAAAALQSRQYDEAARHYAFALERSPAGPASSDVVQPEAAARLREERCRIALGLGEALSRTGRPRDARAAYEQAAAAARHTGADDLFVRAVIGASSSLGLGVGFEYGRHDHELHDMIKAAMNAPISNDALRARLYGRLAIAEFTHQYEPTRVPCTAPSRFDLAEQAVALAESTGDRAAILDALSAYYIATWEPADISRRLDTATKIIQCGSGPTAWQGYIWVVVDQMELGNVDAADAALAGHRNIATQIPHPYYKWWVGLHTGMRQHMQGQFTQALATINRTWNEFGHEYGDRNASSSYYAARLFWARDTGLRYDAGAVQTIEQRVAEYPDVLAWRCALALVYAETAQPDHARREFQRLVDQIEALPHDPVWVAELVILTEVAVLLGDIDRASHLYGLLHPFRDRHALVGSAAVYLGSVHLPLARAAALLGRTDAADTHFRHAIDAHTDVSPPWLARTLLHYAQHLAAQNGRRDEARNVARRAETLARELHMTAVAAAAVQTGRPPRVPPRLAQYRLTQREAEILHIYRAYHGDRRKVAAESHISVKTFDAHLASIKDKLGVENSAQLRKKIDDEALLDASPDDGPDSPRP
jgi:DNA-binding NarL/FixJ family response regulator